MKLIAQILSFLALAATIVPPCLFLAGSMELAQVKWWMLMATVVWFISVPLWMGRQTPADAPPETGSR